jgi:ABC-type multidrug transport system fused ATPase/permease subunit
MMAEGKIAKKKKITFLWKFIFEAIGIIMMCIGLGLFIYVIIIHPSIWAKAAMLLAIILLFFALMSFIVTAKRYWIKYQKSDSTTQEDITCPVCDAVVSRFDLKCPSCGAEFLPEDNQEKIINNIS